MKITLNRKFSESVSLNDALSQWLFSGIKEVKITFDDANNANFNFSFDKQSSCVVAQNAVATSVENIDDAKVERVALKQEKRTESVNAATSTSSTTSTVTDATIEYEDFVEMVENDDGSHETTNEITSYLISATLDVLLRINNEFSLGIDTDKPLDELRNEILSCFQ